VRKPSAKAKAASGVVAPQPEAAAASAGEEDEEEDKDKSGAPRTAQASAGLGAAERELQRMLARKRREAAAADRASSGGGGGARGSGPSAREREAAAAAAADAAKEHEARERIAAMLRDALEVAVGELAAEGADPVPSGAVAQAAQAVEAACYAAFQGLSKEYKTRMRSLQFNLKDPSNPGLRARVLLSELQPHQLVLLTPDQLASKQLSEWRHRKAAEAVRAVTVAADLDTDKLGRRLRKTHKGEEVVDLGGSEADAVTPEPPPAPPLAPDAAHPRGVFIEGLPTPSAERDAGLSPQGGDGGDGALESFESFAVRQQRLEEDSPALAPVAGGGAAKRTRMVMPTGAVHLVALPSTLPPAPPAQQPQPQPSAPAAPPPTKPARAPKPPAEAPPPEGPDWHGTLLNGTPPASLRVHAVPVGGEMAPLGGGFLPTTLAVKGRTSLEEVEKYVLGHLQRGKSSTRSLTLAVASPPPGCDQEAAQQLCSLCDAYEARGRAGLAHPPHGVEVYLLPPTCALARRVLASEGLPPLQRGCMLLVVVHKKGLGAAEPKRLQSPSEVPPAEDAGLLLPSPRPATVQTAPPGPPPHAPPPDIQAPLQALADMLMGQASSHGVLGALSASLGGGMAPQQQMSLLPSPLLQSLLASSSAAQPSYGMPSGPGYALPRRPEEDLPEFDYLGGRLRPPTMQHPPLSQFIQPPRPPLGLPPPRPPPGPPPGSAPPPSWAASAPPVSGAPPAGGWAPPPPPPPPLSFGGPPRGLLQPLPNPMLPPPRPPPGPPPAAQPWMQVGIPPPMPPAGPPPGALRWDPRRGPPPQ